METQSNSLECSQWAAPKVEAIIAELRAKWPGKFLDRGDKGITLRALEDALEEIRG